MASLFDFYGYGTFTGPGNGNYIFNNEEPVWQTQFDLDSLTTSFDLTDVGVIFFNTPFDYSGFHLFGVNTSCIVLERNTGPLPSYIANVATSITNGNSIDNGNDVINGNLAVNGVQTLTGVGNVASYMLTTRSIANSKKSFDIQHPTKQDHRLRYVCLEGPSAEVYIRGKLKDNNVIELPEYWRGLVDPESIGVSLTPIGVYQELFVEKIEWGTKIIVKNNLGGPIHCHYTITAERIDTPKNIPEYQGLTPTDYPGDNESYNVNGL
jgi:hypothetical protein